MVIQKQRDLQVNPVFVSAHRANRSRVYSLGSLGGFPLDQNRFTQRRSFLLNPPGIGQNHVGPVHLLDGFPNLSSENQKERIEGKTSPAILKHTRAGKQNVIEEVEQAGLVLESETDLLKANCYLRIRRP